MKSKLFRPMGFMGWDAKNIVPLGWDYSQKFSSHPIPPRFCKENWSHGMGRDGFVPSHAELWFEDYQTENILMEPMRQEHEQTTQDISDQDSSISGMDSLPRTKNPTVGYHRILSGNPSDFVGSHRNASEIVGTLSLDSDRKLSDVGKRRNILVLIGTGTIQHFPTSDNF